MCVLSLGFNSGIYDKTIWAGESKFCAIFFHLIFDLLEISWQKKLHKNPILLPKLLEYSPLNWNPNRARLFLPHKIYILTLKVKIIIQNIQLLDVLSGYEET